MVMHLCAREITAVAARLYLDYALMPVLAMKGNYIMRDTKGVLHPCP